MKKLIFTSAAALSLSSPAFAVPIFDTFGPLLESEFGGDGIPNDEVAIGVTEFDGTTITAALTAHTRYGNPDVPSDGAGNFTATPGSSVEGPSDIEGALWNFAYYINVEGGGRTIEDLQFNLYYDFDPGEDTAIADLGIIDVTAGVALFSPGATLAEGSENLLFDFLETPSFPFDSLITPPAGSFDPDAMGEYNFAIVASDPETGFAVEIVAIDVQVVPEPTSLALLGLGGLGILRRRR